MDSEDLSEERANWQKGGLGLFTKKCEAYLEENFLRAKFWARSVNESGLGKEDSFEAQGSYITVRFALAKLISPCDEPLSL